MSIYTELKAIGAELDHHESDLYAKVTPEVKAIIEKYDHKNNVTTFHSQIDHELWYDIPFAFDPFWEDKMQGDIAERDPEKTIVLFRQYEGGAVIALFPEIPDDIYGVYCLSYMHVGQHGKAEPQGTINATVPASFDEYIELANELEDLGYKLEIHEKYTRRMHETRQRLAKELNLKAKSQHKHLE